MEQQQVKQRNHEQLRPQRIVYYILGVLEVLLAFRLVFKLLGANPASPFVSFIYSLTQIFLYPFTGIFPTAVTKGFEAQAILEPTTIIAMIVYGIIAWGIVRLIGIMKETERKA